MEVVELKKIWSFVIFYILVIALCIGGTLLGNRAVTVFKENAPVERLHCVIIDPGHGGEDGGALSCTGAAESGLNLQIALVLRDLIHLLGYDTRMIRTTDTAVYTTGTTIAQKKASDLKQRVAMVNGTEGALLVSIHQNTFPDGQYSGAQVFYASTPGSETLAKMMQDAFVATVNPGSRRQCKAAKGIYLMENIRCTGILVECGFLSNPAEEAALRSPGYQKKISCTIASTLCQYLTALDPTEKG